MELAIFELSTDIAPIEHFEPKVNLMRGPVDQAKRRVETRNKRKN